VLFLCTGNSARSQMAEALVRARSVELSGPQRGQPPQGAAPQRGGIDLAGQRSKHPSVFAQQRLDWVISLCDRVREVCPELPGQPKTIHWRIPDPAAVRGDDDEAGYSAFRETAAELETRIGFLLAAITNPSKPVPTTPQEER